MKKGLLLLLFIYITYNLFFEIKYFNIPYWIKNSNSPSILDLSYLLERLLRYLATISSFIGIFQIFRNKKIEILNTLKFPIFYFLIQNLFWVIRTLLSKNDFFFHMSSLNTIVFNLVSLMLIILTIVYYIFKDDKENINSKEATKVKRLTNWGVDILIILPLAMTSFLILQSRNPGLYNNYRNIFILSHSFLYYFILEILTKQTIGKLLSNSRVNCLEENKIKSILIRTLCRFIPLEIFSFLSKKGWHDKFSKTEVTIANKGYK